MKKGKVHIIFGTGMGKTAMALGRGVSAAMHGRKVIMIQFLKGVLSHETADGLKQLEPAFKVFRFEKQNEYYENLSEEGKKEELCNIQNGYNFAKKVLCTGECDMLILDEFLGVLDQKLVGDDALETLLAAREENVDLILTGKVCPAGAEEHAFKWSGNRDGSPLQTDGRSDRCPEGQSSSGTGTVRKPGHPASRRADKPLGSRCDRMARGVLDQL